MANAVKRISVEKGHDVTEYVLTTFGGAGGQHACAVADSLGIRTVLVPPMAGVLSALGIGLADTTVMREQAVEAPLEPETVDRVGEIAAALESIARAELAAEGVPDDRVRVVARAHLRYDGTDNALAVELADLDAMVAAFEASYRTTYSFLLRAAAHRRGGLGRGDRADTAAGSHEHRHDRPDDARSPARDRAPVGRRRVAGRAAVPSASGCPPGRR